jgi:HlyD family secretion protein
MDVPRPDLAQTRSRRRAWVIGIAAGVLVIAGLALQSLAPASPSVARQSVVIATVKAGTFERRVRAPGSLVPDTQRWLTATSIGEVATIERRAGDAVTADTVILTLSNPDLEQELSAARLALRVAEAEYAAREMGVESNRLEQRARVANARATHSSALLQVEAEAEAARTGAVPQLQLKRSRITATELAERLDVELARQDQLDRSSAAELRAHRARQQQLQEVFELARSRRDGLAVRAGIAGVLQSVVVEEGQQVTIGANLARVARPDVLIAQLRVPEALARDIRIGQAARIDLRGTAVSGTVRRVHPIVEQGAVAVEVAPGAPLPADARIDQSMEGVIDVETIPNALFVARPIGAQPLTTGAVFRLAADDELARRIPVRFGPASVGEITIVSGLAAGDRIVVSDLGEWATRDSVQLQ